MIIKDIIMLKKFTLTLFFLLACPVFADEVAVVDKADNGFMMICTALVLFIDRKSVV